MVARSTATACADAETRAFDGIHAIPTAELFPPSFMRRHTSFGSFVEMIQAGNFNAWDVESFNHLDPVAWDQYVRRVTGFGSWRAMWRSATSEWIYRELVDHREG